MTKKAALGMVLAITSVNSFGGTVVCTGTVDALAYHAGEGLMLRLSSMNTPVFICSPDSTWSVSGTLYTTPPQSCKALYASFLTAKVTRASLPAVYFDGDEVPTACNTWASWSRANIRFFNF